MKNIHQLKEGYSVYPGEYRPARLENAEAGSGVVNIATGDAGQVFSNVIECVDHYKIEILAPGHKKDDFIITIDKGRLNIFTLKRKPQIKEEPLYHLHGFDYDVFEKSILLPVSVDLDFIRAEYKEGIVTIYFQKTENPVLNTFRNVIVY